MKNLAADAQTPFKLDNFLKIVSSSVQSTYYCYTVNSR